MPGPISTLVGGTTNAAGAAVVPLQSVFPPAEWACFGAILTLPGAPSVTLTVNGVVAAVGGGQAAAIGPAMFQGGSGRAVSINVTNGPPNTVFQVTVIGWSDPDPTVAQAQGGAASVAVAGIQQLGSPLIDGPLDIQVLNGGSSTVTGPLQRATFGPFNCQSWASFAAYMQPNNPAAPSGFAATYTFTWYADSTLLIPIDDRQFTLDGSSNVGSGFIILPNLGPWLVVTVDTAPLSNTPFVHTFYGYRTQRSVNPEWRLGAPWLIPVTQVAVPVGTTNIGAAFMYAGPCGYRFFNGAQPGNAAFQAMDANGVYRAFYNSNLAASSSDNGVIDLPEGWLRIAVTNTGAATANFTFSIWPIVTGAR